LTPWFALSFCKAALKVTAVAAGAIPATLLLIATEIVLVTLTVNALVPVLLAESLT
jgi:hypothetical protein